ncbi:hypothetical protein [Micromonospora arida]
MDASTWESVIPTMGYVAFGTTGTPSAGLSDVAFAMIPLIEAGSQERWPF